MRSKNIKLLSLIIPVYHQERTIRKQLQNIIGELELLATPYEVIVVVDGLDDKCFEEAKKFTRTRSPLPDTNESQEGTRCSVWKSHGDVIGFLDAGGDLSELGLSMMTEHYKWYNADIIIGSKRHPVSKSRTQLRGKFYPGDINNWCVCYSAQRERHPSRHETVPQEVLEDVLPRLVVKQFAFDIEILAVAYHLGYRRIFEAPVELDFTGLPALPLWGCGKPYGTCSGIHSPCITDCTYCIIMIISTSGNGSLTKA